MLGFVVEVEVTGEGPDDTPVRVGVTSPTPDNSVMDVFEMADFSFFPVKFVVPIDPVVESPAAMEII